MSLKGEWDFLSSRDPLVILHRLILRRSEIFLWLMPLSRSFTSSHLVEISSISFLVRMLFKKGLNLLAVVCFGEYGGYFF